MAGRLHMTTVHEPATLVLETHGDYGDARRPTETHGDHGDHRDHAYP